MLKELILGALPGFVKPEVLKCSSPVLFFNLGSDGGGAVPGLKLCFVRSGGGFAGRELWDLCVFSCRSTANKKHEDLHDNLELYCVRNPIG